LKVGSHRLLGFAFANADLLLEIAPAGEIAFAIGAGEALSGSADVQLIGRPWRDFVEAIDTPMIEALFDGLEPGQRGGPVGRLPSRRSGCRRTAARCPARSPAPLPTRRKPPASCSTGNPSRRSPQR
jgi:hypothetical protein